MRIGFDAKRVFCNQRGLGNYGRTLIDSLIHYYPHLELNLYTPLHGQGELQAWEREFLNKCDGKIITPGGAWKLLPSGWRTFRPASLGKKDQLDIYHGLSHELPVGISRSGIKSVVTIHDLLYLRLPEHFSPIDRNVYHRKIIHSCKSADAIVAIGEQTKQDLIDKLKVDPQRIEVVYQSCSSNFYQLLPPEALEATRIRYELPKNFLLYVGAITAAKNITAIVHALKLLPPEHTLPLVVVGRESSYLPQLQEEIAKLELEERVIFKTPAGEDLPAIYQLATIFTFPSLFEGFGIPIIESLFSGTPVITTDEAVFKEAGGDGSRYIDPTSPKELAKMIASLLDHPDQREEMSKRGRIYVQRFHQKATTQKMFDLYRKILER
jgi:glycosyltransferase involved in cell wall biosynthesis